MTEILYQLELVFILYTVHNNTSSAMVGFPLCFLEIINGSFYGIPTSSFPGLTSYKFILSRCYLHSIVIFGCLRIFKNAGHFHFSDLAGNLSMAFLSGRRKKKILSCPVVDKGISFMKLSFIYI